MSVNYKSGPSSSPLLVGVRKSALALFCLVIALPSCSTSPAPQASAPAATTSPAAMAPATTTTTTAMAPSPATSPVSEANKSQETKAIEASIVSTLSPQLPSPVTAANCPNLEKLEAGKVFDCDLTTADGHFPGTVTLKDTDGGFNVNTKNVLVMPALEKELVESIKRENQTDVKADCGSAKMKIFKNVGEQVECKLTQPNGKSGTATATVTTLAGGVDAKWKIEQ